MKPIIYSFLMFCACASWVSCEEDDAELMFTTKLCAPHNNVKIEYYSPDPLHVSRSYWITANKYASELVIKCRNASDIYIAGLSDELPDDYDPDVELEGIVDGDTYISPNGYWSVTLVDSNTLKFVFDEVQEPNPHYTLGMVGSAVMVTAPLSKGQLQTGIKILRYLDYSGPIN